MWEKQAGKWDVKKRQVRKTANSWLTHDEFFFEGNSIYRMVF